MMTDAAEAACDRLICYLTDELPQNSSRSSEITTKRRNSFKLMLFTKA